MAILSMGPVATSAHGSAGGVVFRRHGGLTLGTARVKRADDRSASQLLVRERVARASSVWRQLSPTVRAGWAQAAAVMPRGSFKGSLTSSRGFSVYLHHALRVADVGVDVVNYAPSEPRWVAALEQIRLWDAAGLWITQLGATPVPGAGVIPRALPSGWSEVSKVGAEFEPQLKWPSDRLYRTDVVPDSVGLAEGLGWGQVQFNALGSVIVPALVPPIQFYFFEVWIKPTVLFTPGYLVSRPGNLLDFFYNKDGSGRLGFFDGADTFSILQPVLGQWNQCFAAFDSVGGAAIFGLNGVFDPTVYPFAGPQLAGFVRFFNKLPTGSNGVTGQISSFLVGNFQGTNYSLSQSYNGGAGYPRGNFLGMVGAWTPPGPGITSWDSVFVGGLVAQSNITGSYVPGAYARRLVPSVDVRLNPQSRVIRSRTVSTVAAGFLDRVERQEGV